MRLLGFEFQPSSPPFSHSLDLKLAGYARLNSIKAVVDIAISKRINVIGVFVTGAILLDVCYRTTPKEEWWVKSLYVDFL